MPIASEVTPLIPLTIPFCSACSAFGTALDTLEFASPALDELTPALSQPALRLARAAARRGADLGALILDPGEDQDQHGDGDRDDPEQDDPGARDARDAMALHPADERHRHGRDHRADDDGPDDRVGRRQEPHDADQQGERADEEPRRPADVLEPARRREHGGELVDVAGLRAATGRRPPARPRARHHRRGFRYGSNRASPRTESAR